MVQKVFSLAAALFLIATHVNAADDQSIWYEPYENITYGELRTLIENDKVEAARVLDGGWWVTVKTKEGEYFDIRVTPQTPIADRLYEAGVPVGFEYRSDPEEESPQWLEMFYKLLPLLIFIVFFGFVMFLIKRGNKDYYSRSEKMQAEFFERLEKVLTERKDENG